MCSSDLLTALRTAEQAADDATQELMRDIQRDEARWCGVLTRAIRALDGAPSRRTGDFVDKAMAIADLPTRLTFLNRGQSWVVKRLNALLPQVKDEALYRDLRIMRDVHEENIARVAAKSP